MPNSWINQLLWFKNKINNSIKKETHKKEYYKKVWSKRAYK